MNRQLHDLMVTQYATPKVSGDWLVSWDKGVKCVMPGVKLLGAAEQGGTPTPDTPIMPVCNDGVFAGRGLNLLGITVGNVSFTNCIPNGKSSIKVNIVNSYYASISINRPVGLKNGTPLTLSCVGNADGTQLTIVVQGIRENGKSSGEDSSFGNFVTYTPVDFVEFERIELRFCRKSDRYTNTDTVITNIQLEPGDTATPYTPYWDGGRATAPELWAIPGTDIRDEWDAQTGKGIRRVKKLVLDGTEVWDFSIKKYFILHVTDSEKGNVMGSEKLSVCSHFGYKAGTWDNSTIQYGYVANNAVYQFRNLDCETLDDWKAFLSAQYAAGAPVAVWYALAEPEPFYHAPARLTQPHGPGQIIQVSGSVPECPIEVNYLTHAGGAK